MVLANNGICTYVRRFTGVYQHKMRRGMTLEEWKCFAVRSVILSKLVIKEWAASGRLCSMCSRLLPALGFIMIMGY